MGALNAVLADREANWSAGDVAARMDFALRCAYAHGTVAIRTHLDSRYDQTGISWPVFGEMREKWAGRIALQATPLFSIDLALDKGHMAAISEMVSRFGQTIGAVTYACPELPAGLAAMFRLASEKGWNLDFHVDETLDPSAASLRLIAEQALEHGFQGNILVGHCCSLSVQPEDDAARTMDLVAKAGISVVSLPMCNMYLQSRGAATTPRNRGVTLLHELAGRGVNVMVASDNTRDPFYAYGDLDLVEVYREATRIAHLDHPVGDWPRAITSAPAKALGLDIGLLKVGARLIWCSCAPAAGRSSCRARRWTARCCAPASPSTPRCRIIVNWTRSWGCRQRRPFLLPREKVAAKPSDEGYDDRNENRPRVPSRLVPSPSSTCSAGTFSRGEGSRRRSAEPGHLPLDPLRESCRRSACPTASIRCSATHFVRQRGWTSGLKPRSRIRRPGAPMAMVHHHHGDPSVVRIAMLRICVRTRPIGLSPSGIVNVACGIQTRSSQPFSMAGCAYHQVG